MCLPLPSSYTSITSVHLQALIEVPKLAAIPVLGDIVTAPGVRQIMEAIVPGEILSCGATAVGWDLARGED